MAYNRRGLLLRLTTHFIAMRIEETQPFDPDSPETILYRCACGNNVRLDPKSGGQCEKCGRSVSTKVLNNDLAATMTITGSFTDLDREHGNSDESYDPREYIGRQFGHYEIIQPLGRGGSGFVYRALDTSLQRYVAVKILRSNLLDSKRADGRSEVDLLLEEAVAQARVAHPNIVSIYFVGTDPQEPFYAMELVDGISLSERLSEGQLQFTEISDIADDIVSALRFSYELDVIHGDIKPSNILLCKTGGAKLSDFGLARRASDTVTMVTGGTPNYLAPEILFGQTPSVQSDMYALGVTLFEMTFGKLPIQMSGTTVASWQESHNSQQIEFPDDWPENLPPQWKIFLEKLLAREPSDRYSSYDEVAAELSRLQPTSNVGASPLPRIIATLIDWLTVILLMLPFRSDFVFDFVQASGWLQAIVYVADFLPIMVYTTIVFFWKQSVGRQLMQLRVLNRFGMVPKGRKMVFRSVLRMIVPWAMAFMLLFSIVPGATSGRLFTAAVIAIAILVYLLVSTACLLFSKRNRSLHDYIFETQVVIDS